MLPPCGDQRRSIWVEETARCPAKQSACRVAVPAANRGAIFAGYVRRPTAHGGDLAASFVVDTTANRSLGIARPIEMST